MPNKYTDQQMIWAAQISYFNFTKDEIEDWKSKHQNEYPTVRELLLNRANAYKNGYIPNAGLKTDDPAREEAYKALYNFDIAKAAVIDPNTGEIADEGTRTNVEFINALLGINYAEAIEENNDPIGEVWDIGTLESPDVIVDGEAQWYLECADWKVYNVKDHNSGSQSGLYALTLMPAEGEAIVAYRGSEIGIVDGNEQTIQFLMDWMYADGGLAYGTLTDQEKYAAEYLKMILDDENFTSVASSGHSLGGDLALTAAVISAYDDEKYVQGASFDGPGHPQKFMKLYADRIEAIQHKFRHYHYTLVGALYNSLAGENYFQAGILPTEASLFSKAFGLFPHSMYNIDIKSSNGMVNAGAQNVLSQRYSKICDNILKILDNVTPKLDDNAVTLVSGAYAAYCMGFMANNWSSFSPAQQQEYMNACMPALLGAMELAVRAYGTLISPGLVDLYNVMQALYNDNIMKDAIPGLMGEGYEDLIVGTNGNDIIYARDLSALVFAGKGNDTVYGNDGGDIIYGGSGNDLLNGDSGKDTLIGGTGDDTLLGGSDDDTYVFAEEDGDDVIYDYQDDLSRSRKDRIRFDARIDKQNVKLERQGSHLLIRYGKGDSITVDCAYSSQGRYLVEEIAFSDGTVWGVEEIANRVNKLNGTGGNDVISGYSKEEGYNDAETIHGFQGEDEIYGNDGADRLYGDAGHDSLYGGNSDDLLVGGTGYDYLAGGSGNDTYFFEAGDGTDTIHDYEYDLKQSRMDQIWFGESVSREKVRLERHGSHLLITYGENDSITVDCAYSSQGRYLVEGIIFNDEAKTVWGVEEIANRANKLKGTTGNDVISGYGKEEGYNNSETIYALTGDDTVYAGDGNDVVYGGAGNDDLYGQEGKDVLFGGDGDDYLSGGSQDDIYFFNKGDGVDTIYDYQYDLSQSRKDRIEFGKSIEVKDVKLQREGSHLIITYGENSRIKVDSAYSSLGRYLVEEIAFNDKEKTVWDVEEIANRANKLIGTQGNDVISGYVTETGYNSSESIHGCGGDDEIHAGGGNDKVYGDSGNDSLYGDAGDDTLTGGTGDDSLYGGSQNDTYVFRYGDGNDTIYERTDDLTQSRKDKIKFGTGIKAEDVKLEREGAHLIIKHRLNDNDSITVDSAYNAYGRYLVEEIAFSDGTVWDVKEIANRANQLDGTAGNDVMYGYSAAEGYNNWETIHGLEGNDTIYAGDGKDEIHGDTGNDSLYGDNGDDTLIGGKGDDFLAGGSQNDTYVFESGDGNDVIYDYQYERIQSCEDKIVFGESVDPDDVRLQRSGAHLIIKYGEKDSIRVDSAYNSYGRYMVEEIVFKKDGTVWNLENISNRANQLGGTDGNDVIYGHSSEVGYINSETIHGYDGNDTICAGEGNDEIHGDAGNDSLYGENGLDTLIGGKGDDFLAGGSHNDTYIFESGDGNDVIYDYQYERIQSREDKIKFGTGIMAEDVKLEREGAHLIIKHRLNDNDSIRVDSAYNSYGRYLVEEIAFEDGTVWKMEDIANLANQLDGTAGNDVMSGYSAAEGYNNSETIHGLEGNDEIHGNDGKDTLYGDAGYDSLYGDTGEDTLIGGTGDDYLAGGANDDTYVFAKGAGDDIIYDYQYDLTQSRKDRIEFKEGIKAEDVKIEREGAHLMITYGSEDSIRVDSAYNSYGRYLVEEIVFSDGTVWDVNEIANLANKLDGTAGNDVMSGYSAAEGYNSSETIHGLEGNDEIHGNDGKDTLYGDAGYDSLYGDDGDDTLIGGKGDDYLAGGANDDTYVFAKGAGDDIIYDYQYDLTQSRKDRIEFKEGIKAEDVKIEREGAHLMITYGSEDSIRVDSAYNSYGRYLVEEIVFSDGTVWDVNEIANRANKLDGTAGNDVMSGYSAAEGYNNWETIHGLGGDDTIYAGDGKDEIHGDAGNDSLYGDNGDDTLIGGKGDDYLAGGYQNDTYEFESGDGNDVIYDYQYDRIQSCEDRIEFKEGIKAEDVKIEREGAHLMITYGSEDSIRVDSAFNSYGRYLVEEIVFDEDGTVWGVDEIANLANKLDGTLGNDIMSGYSAAEGYNNSETIHGFQGNDTVYAGDGNDEIHGDGGNDSLYGDNGDDTLIGGKGDDFLAGGANDDTYVFAKGAGADTIYDYEYDLSQSRNDRIQFGEGIRVADVRLERTGSNLVINYGEGDSVTVDFAYDAYGRYQVEHVDFADGTTTDINYETVSLEITGKTEPATVEESVTENVTVPEPVTVAEPATVAETASVTETASVPEPATVAEPVTVAETASVPEPATVAEPATVTETASATEPAPVSIDEMVTAMDEVMNGADASVVSDEMQAATVPEPAETGVADMPDVERMTNLMIQEMAGTTESGVTENVTFKEAETTVDPLLWSA